MKGDIIVIIIFIILCVTCLFLFSKKTNNDTKPSSIDKNNSNVEPQTPNIKTTTTKCSNNQCLQGSYCDPKTGKCICKDPTQIYDINNKGCICNCNGNCGDCNNSCQGNCKSGYICEKVNGKFICNENKSVSTCRNMDCKNGSTCNDKTLKCECPNGGIYDDIKGCINSQIPKPNVSPTKITKAVKFNLNNLSSEYIGPGIPSSTTDFGFGGNASCACKGDELNKDLLQIGYIPVATPDWLQTPFATTGTADAKGGSTYKDVYGTKYVSNCSLGSGGCGKCWELTTTGKKSMGIGSTAPAGIKAKVVTIDTCEDRNNYGNNYQWCVAASGIPEGGIDTKSYSGRDPPKEWGDKLRLGTFKFNNDKGMSEWVPHPDCIDKDGNWICTNVAGYPLHFDFGIQNLDEATLKYLNLWNKGDNPAVIARPIKCDDKVNEILKKKCGGNSSDGTKACQYYCPPSTKEKGVPKWWGNCENDYSCASSFGQCGGEGYTGPTCCQWGQTCVKCSKYYSGCKDPSNTNC